jgi:hypothetical protein
MFLFWSEIQDDHHHWNKKPPDSNLAVFEQVPFFKAHPVQDMQFQKNMHVWIILENNDTLY